MADREADIKAALLARLALITLANGYNTEAGVRVFTREEYNTAEATKPCLLVNYGERSDTLEGEIPPCLGEENHYLPIVVTGICDDSETGATADLLKKDLLRALKGDPHFGGLAEGFDGGFKIGVVTAPAVTTDPVTGEQRETGGFVGGVEVSTAIFYVTAYGEE